MPSLLDRCPVCAAPGLAGELCSTPACRAQGARYVASDPEDPTGPDGIVFDLGSLQAQFADIPDPEDRPPDPAALPPPPPPPRRRPPVEAALIAPPPAPPRKSNADEDWAANWSPPPPRREVERTLLVEPIRDDDELPQPKAKGKGSVLMVIMVLAALALLGAVIWLMLNPPAPSTKPRTHTIERGEARSALASTYRQQRKPTSSSAKPSTMS